MLHLVSSNIHRLATLLISPLGTAVLLWIPSLALARRGYARVAAICGVAAVAWLWLWSTPAVSLWICMRLESQHPARRVSVLPRADAIVVLGGAVSPPTPPRSSVDLGSAADRVWYAARLYHAGKAPLIVLSGGSDPAVNSLSEAESMQLFLRDLGVPDSAMLLETRSRNTRQNAEFSADLLHARGLRRILLVTSALHMHRAIGEFAARGLEVTAATTDIEAVETPADVWRYLPDAEALAASARALKELVGQWVLVGSRHYGVVTS
jgi:uncharacterized SAM-binding protein YcdF (DUF218 family)